jgi:hypothetical protein
VMEGWLHDLGLATTTRRLDAGRLHPHHLLVGTVPPAARPRTAGT